MDVPSDLVTRGLEKLDISSSNTDNGVQTYKLGDWKLQSGESLPNAHIAYKTYGDPKSPAIIYPTWYSGSIADNEWLIGPNKTLSPTKYHIIIPALFGNGQSTSPSNTALSPFPDCTFYDNVRAQHALVTQHLGITHARAVLGWSMGAGQTFQWATQYPSFMDIIVPFCGSARTSLHNVVFLEGVKSALLAAKGARSAGSCHGSVLPAGETHRSPWTDQEKDVGLRAFARVYAGWGFSQAFYREGLYEKVLGYKDLEDFMVGFWEKWALEKDPENLLTMLHTWQSGDISQQDPYNGSFPAALAAIRAQALVLPGLTDLYFPPEDSEIEVSHMREGVGRCVVFPSIWGHWAGGPGNSEEDVRWLDERLREVGL